MNIVATGGLALVSLGRIEHGKGFEIKIIIRYGFGNFFLAIVNKNRLILLYNSAISEAEFNLRSLSTNIFSGPLNS